MSEQLGVVWIVTNGTGGEIDRVYDDPDAARARVAELNKPGGEMLAWTVVQRNLIYAGSGGGGYG